jgi:hypothetical protein
VFDRMSTQLQVQTKATRLPSSAPAQTGFLQRKCACGQHTVAGGECEECRRRREGVLQRAAVNNAPVNGVPPIVHDVLNTPGQPLDAGTRAFMEPRFGHDFSGVRVHTDARAAESARSVNALAYTVGRNVVFGPGQYVPETSKGQRLLAHELTHTLQQASTEPYEKENLRLGELGNASELEANIIASEITSGKDMRIALHNTVHVPQIQRAGLFESIARLFGGGTFSDQELQEYLQFLDKTNHIEDHYDSDNKAREVVRRWQTGNALYILPPRRKVLLIREMLTGFTSKADERGILALLSGSTETEFAEILRSVGIEELRSNMEGDERKQLDTIVANRQQAAAGGQPPAAVEPSPEIFPAEIVLEAQRRFTSNAELEKHVRLDCISIVRAMAPQLFAQDPKLAERVRTSLSKLKGKKLTMPDAMNALTELGAATGPTEVVFNNENGNREPTAMISSAWDAIMEMVGDTEGWHIFGLAVMDGEHSVTVFVDNRADGRRVYWADQWAIEPGDEFHQEVGSVSGFRRYEKAGFDKFIEEKTREWWNDVHRPDSKCGKNHPKTWDRSCRYTATLKIWHLRSGHS